MDHLIDSKHRKLSADVNSQICGAHISHRQINLEGKDVRVRMKRSINPVHSKRFLLQSDDGGASSATMGIHRFRKYVIDYNLAL